MGVHLPCSVLRFSYRLSTSLGSDIGVYTDGSRHLSGSVCLCTVVRLLCVDTL